MAGAASTIENTLRDSRARFEIAVSRYRSIMFFLAAVASLIPSPHADSEGWFRFVPPLWFAIVFVYALAVAWLVHRQYRLRGTVSPVFAYVTFVVDLLAATVPTALMIKSAAPTEIVVMFARYMTAVSVFAVLFVHAFRAHRPSWVCGSIAAVAVFLGVSFITTGWEEPQLIITILLVGMGAIGWVAAGLSRERLEIFARRQLFERYLPQGAVVRVLQEDPETALGLGGRTEVVTILATDLRDFTGLSEKLEATELVRQLNEYHGTMLECIREHDGVLDKFVGDGALAVFGLGVESKDHGAASAWACAREMLERLSQLNVSRAQRNLSELRMGIGIHTGEVVAGNIGSENRLEFTVIGDTVNTASRLEGLTKELDGNIAVSADTVRELGDADGLSSVGPRHLRGRDREIEVFCEA